MIEMALFMKSMFTLFVAILVWVYWKYYGPQNFLWASDIALFLTLGAVWLESPLLISICIVAFFFLEVVWNFDFLIELITGKSVIGIAHYMFESHYPLFLRSFSLFHVLLIPLWLWHNFYWGYDAHAFIYAVPVVWMILIASYLCTDPTQNINWVFIPKMYHWKKISVMTWLILLLVGYPLLVCFPTHMIFVQFAR